MNNDFARTPLFLFPWKHPSLSTKWVRQKYSIKTSGLNSSFIILGLICNCRFVFCHFEAEMRATKLLLLVIFLQSSLGFHHFDLSNSHENAGISYSLRCYLCTVRLAPHLRIFTCSLHSVKRAVILRYCCVQKVIRVKSDLQFVTHSAISCRKPLTMYLCSCPRLPSRQVQHIDRLFIDGGREWAVKKRWKSHWVASGGGAVREN